METCTVCGSAALRVAVTQKGYIYERCLVCGAVKLIRNPPIPKLTVAA